MKKSVCLFAVLGLLASPLRAASISDDVSDPLFFGKQTDLALGMSVDIGSDFQIRQNVTYVFTNSFSVSADFKYRVGNEDEENDQSESNGFSKIGLLGKYRAGSGSSGATDVLFGIGYGGLTVAPNYSDRVYSVGARTGKQWNGMTLALTAMTNWIFGNEEGLAYIDLTPEAYFRVRGGWAIGLGGTIRRATATIYDQVWLNARLGSVVGKTGWFANIAYELDSDEVNPGKEFRVGGSVNMLF
jgi:hypothetical protein